MIIGRVNGLGTWWRTRILNREYARYARSDWDQAWRHLPLLSGLSEPDAIRLRDLTVLLLRDKRLESAQGLDITAPMRLTVGLQAALPILELGLDWYRNWYAIILYPDVFVPTREVMDEDGLVWTETEAKSGEAWEQGPVILSWADVAASGQLDGYNVVIHEMAHKLDLRAGPANGCPPLHAGMSHPAWARDFAAAYADLRRRVTRGADTSIDPYASESPAEFFAVVSEVFFECPALLADAYPAVHAQLRAFYRQDPLTRLASPMTR